MRHLGLFPFVPLLTPEDLAVSSHLYRNTGYLRLLLEAYQYDFG